VSTSLTFKTHGSVSHAPKNGECIHYISILAWKTKYDLGVFIALWSLVQTKKNLLWRCQHIRRKHIPDLNQPFLRYEPLKSQSFSSFLFAKKNANLHQIAFNIWYTLKGILGAPCNQIWFKYKQNWQTYKWFFMKIDTNMLLHYKANHLS